MTIRYFQATDGVITVFRASATRTYASAYFYRVPAETRPGTISFSAKPPIAGTFAAVEINKTEYEALQAAKVRRVRAENVRWATSPQQSWVRNADLLPSER